jgi:hypothetical protein
MKLVKESKGVWQYHLAQNEADVLVGLLKKFPFTKIDAVKISKTDKHPKAREREKLLNESLAEHRKELKKLALDLIRPDKLKLEEKGLLMTLSSENRETMLQILNDIRVGSWRVLGEPDDLHTNTPQTSAKDLAYRSLMDLAGYFECGLLTTES